MKSFDEFKNEFLHVCEFTRRLDSKTLRAYKTDLLQFQSYLQSGSLSFLEKLSAITWKLSTNDMLLHP